MYKRKTIEFENDSSILVGLGAIIDRINLGPNPGNQALLLYADDGENIRMPECEFLEGCSDYIHLCLTSPNPEAWAIRSATSCLNKDGNWEYEPMPSSREDDFIERTRWDSAITAFHFYQDWKQELYKEKL